MLDKTEFARLVAEAKLSTGTTAATVSTPSLAAVKTNLFPKVFYPILLPQ